MKIEQKGIKEAQQLFDKMAKGLSSLPQDEKEEIIVKDSQFTKGNNFVDTSKISETAEDARHEARYVAARLQQPFDETGMPPKEVEEAEEEIIDRYIRDYIDSLLRE